MEKSIIKINMETWYELISQTRKRYNGRSSARVYLSTKQPFLNGNKVSLQMGRVCGLINPKNVT